MTDDEIATLPLEFEQIDTDLYKGTVPSSGTMIGIFITNSDGLYEQKQDNEIITYKNVKMTVMTLRMLLIYESI